MVVTYLSDDEALKVAMNVEKQGIDLYKKMSDVVKDPDTSKLLSWLSEEEKKHFQMFKEADEKILSGPKSRPLEINEEISAYLRSLVDTGIFSHLSEFSPDQVKELNQVQALKLAIGVEKDSILFYDEAQKYSTNPSGKKTFGEIMQEERRHLIKLADRLRQIKQK